MSPHIFKIGQRYISNAEPELGMGRVTALAHRLVTLRFDVSEEDRTYAQQQAPLTRVRFASGDRIVTQANLSLQVESVTERNGILVYHGINQGTQIEVVETELDANVRFNKPQDRLFTHQIDENKWFNLRYHTLRHQARQAESEYQGLYGPRISLIPHQLYIANEVANRFAPRVLLADEVGLGKTIEAGLIIHKQLMTSRSSRVLIIVPPALTFQWFVELIRKFNLQFTILDEDRCQQIEMDNSEEQILEDETVEGFNPFDAQQLMLCTLDLFLDDPLRLKQLLDAEIDLAVVDEAHHLHWSSVAASPEYHLVDQISQHTRGLLLLTATPEQLGKEGHFARLRLLDPARFHDLDSFIREEDSYEPVAEIANQLIDSQKQADLTAIESFLGVTGQTHSHEELLQMLLDRHGTGRVLFRNVRSSIAGFPGRIPQPVPLESPPQYDDVDNPFFPELNFYRQGASNWTAFDPRVNWLHGLAKSFPKDKILVICAHRETAIQLEAFVTANTAVRSTAFHEALDLIARDRAAAYFAESEQGAQMMICSEIGSEGRNFQFSHKLVLFDLPLSPDLVEQRIGRLDRIGQQRDVSIYIPYFKNTAQHSLFRVFHEGLNIFATPNPAAQPLFEEMLDKLGDSEIDDLVEEIRQLNQSRREMLNKGRDKLLELHSHNQKESRLMVADIEQQDGDDHLESYMEKSFEAWGLDSEYLGEDIYLVRPTEAMTRHGSVSIETQGHYHYPEIAEEGVRLTYKRSVALSRDDVLFLTWEAPMVRQALDIVATDLLGNSSVVVIKHRQLKAGTLLVEVLHVLESVSPAEWNVPRYLPPRVIRSVIDPAKKDVVDHFPFQALEEIKLEFPKETLNKIVDSQAEDLKAMIEVAMTSAEKNLATTKSAAQITMESLFTEEITRLTELKKVNPSVRPEEIAFLKQRKNDIGTAIDKASIRLDSIRVIVAA